MNTTPEARTKPLPIYETFHSFQGEGTHMGRNAFFIRLFGCPVHCPWCDSAGTWHPDHIPERIERVTPETLAEAAAAAKPDFVVVTGGEPAIHDLSALTELLHARDVPVHLETSGAFPIRGHFDWVTLSPKRWKPPVPDALVLAHELKVIVDRAEEIAFWDAELNLKEETRPVWLHPEWSLRQDKTILAAISEWVRAYGAPFRAGIQLHKHYGVE